jgi:hypothetical protein
MIRAMMSNKGNKRIRAMVATVISSNLFSRNETQRLAESLRALFFKARKRLSLWALLLLLKKGIIAA